MLIRNFEIHAPPSPTRYSGHPSTIDIMLSTTRLPIESITTTDDLGSDHLPVLVKLPLNPTRDFNKSKCYTKANWVKYKRFLNQRINNKDFQFPDDFECNDIDTRIEKLTKIVNHAADSSIPMVRIQPQKPAMTNRIRLLIQRRRTIKRQLDRTGHRLLRIMYRNVFELIKRASSAKTTFSKSTSKLSNPTITTIRNYGQSPEYLEEEMLVYLTLSTKGSFL